jgi:hypothetical protein
LIRWVVAAISPLAQADSSNSSSQMEFAQIEVDKIKEKQDALLQVFDILRF